MKKYKVYIVTKNFEEAGEDLIEQYIIQAESKKKAIEELLEKEGLSIEEKTYVPKEFEFSAKDNGDGSRQASAI